MQRHFVEELEAVKTNLIKMGSFAEESIARAIRALLERNADLAREVITQDERINSLEIEIDDAIVDLLALQQPVATDLRFILAAMKINNDLERIGDHAVNIAESALQYAGGEPVKPFVDLPKMAQVTKEMLRDSIDAFIHSDSAKARTVLVSDDTIDDLNRKIVAELVALIRSDHAVIEQALDLIRVSRNLERVADLSTNIAEEVVFIAEAHVVKHHAEGNPPGSTR
ncbi:MAG TPA: phosphate signaling complex protein PhoU [Bacteroidota bacterium]|nr:phosphate signaling complex protein PhoU [Bacteroidota bacterium]